MPDVVIPVLDEAAALPSLLAAMPAGYRPIVVDNGSADGSGDIAARLGVVVVCEPKRGFGAACWAGLAAADAEDGVVSMRAARAVELRALGIADRRSGWPLEMVLRAAGAGWRLVEVPVPYRPRTGKSKLTGTLRGTAGAIRDMARVLR